MWGMIAYVLCYARHGVRFENLMMLDEFYSRLWYDTPIEALWLVMLTPRSHLT